MSSPFSATDSYQEDGPAHQQVRRKASHIPEAIPIPPSSPTHVLPQQGEGGAGVEGETEEIRGLFPGITILTEPPAAPSSAKDEQISVQLSSFVPSDPQRCDSSSSSSSSVHPVPYPPTVEHGQIAALAEQHGHHHHHPHPHPHHQPAILVSPPPPVQQRVSPSNAAANAAAAGSAAGYTHLPFQMHSPVAQSPSPSPISFLSGHLVPPSSHGVVLPLTRSSSYRKPHHLNPPLPLDMVDELSEATASGVTGMTRSASFNSLFPPSTTSGRHRYPSSSSSPPRVARSSSTTPSNREHKKRNRHKHQQQPHGEWVHAQDPSSIPSAVGSGPHSPTSSSSSSHAFPYRVSPSARLGVGELPVRSSSYSHTTSPSPSLPPSPRSARVLQSIRDSFTSSSAASSRQPSFDFNVHATLPTSAARNNLPFSTLSRSSSSSSLFDERKEPTAFSSPASFGPSSHDESLYPTTTPPHPTLPHSHSYSHASSSSPSYPPTVPLDDATTPEFTTLTRHSSSSSTTARTRPHSPTGSGSMSAGSSVIDDTSTNANFHWTSYLFEPWQEGGGGGGQHHQRSPLNGEVWQLPPPMEEYEPLEPPQINPAAADWDEEQRDAALSSGNYCAVCLSEGCDSFLLPCQHPFHARCILAWVESDHQQPQHRLSCPLCRATIEQFVPMDDQIEDKDGELLARFLRAWEKHYLQPARPDPDRPTNQGGEDGDQLIKPASTQQMMEEPTKQQQQQVQTESAQVEDATASTVPLSAEQAAWQQLYQDILFIPDSLPDDFIIPQASPYDHSHEEHEDYLPMADDHAANIAAINGGTLPEAGNRSKLLSWLQTPFSLLSSFYSAMGSRTPSRPASPALTSSSSAAGSLRLDDRRSRQMRAALSRFQSQTVRVERMPPRVPKPTRPLRALFEREEESKEEPQEAQQQANPSSASARAAAAALWAGPKVAAPTGTSVFAGAAAGGANFISQTLTHTGGRAFAPAPAYATMPALAAYFTSYELMKAEMGLSPSFEQFQEDMANRDPSAETDGSPYPNAHDPRAQLLNANATARYFLSASTGGAISQMVKVALSPGVVSLAGAFVSTAQISARMGIQFSVFEQTKNAFALYRHKRPGEELNAGEVLLAATLGGVVSASVMYPLQHFIPLHHWQITAPPPHAPPAATTTPFPGAAPAAGPATAGPTNAPPGSSGFPSQFKPTMLSCLARFLPMCVATAVTYEYAYRLVRRPAQSRQAEASSSGSRSSSAPSASSFASPIPLLSSRESPSFSSSSSTGLSSLLSPHSLIDGIVSRTASLLNFMGRPATREEIMTAMPIRPTTEQRRRREEERNNRAEREVEEGHRSSSAAAASAGLARPAASHIPPMAAVLAPFPVAASSSAVAPAAAALPFSSTASLARPSLSRSTSVPMLASLRSPPSRPQPKSPDIDPW